MMNIVAWQSEKRTPASVEESARSDTSSPFNLRVPIVPGAYLRLMQ